MRRLCVLLCPLGAWTKDLQALFRVLKEAICDLHSLFCLLADVICDLKCLIRTLNAVIYDLAALFGVFCTLINHPLVQFGDPGLVDWHLADSSKTHGERADDSDPGRP